jgi:hypothetical protein
MTWASTILPSREEYIHGAKYHKVMGSINIYMLYMEIRELIQMVDMELVTLIQYLVYSYDLALYYVL